jgi:hypothetical protein
MTPIRPDGPTTHPKLGEAGFIFLISAARSF